MLVKNCLPLQQQSILRRRVPVNAGDIRYKIKKPASDDHVDADRQFLSFIVDPSYQKQSTILAQNATMPSDEAAMERAM